MTRHRMAVVGLGMAVTPHAKSLIDLQDRLEVVAAFSPSAQRRAEFAARYPFPTCDSFDNILTDPTIDSVLVLTPPNTHRDIVLQVAAAGKHVLLEKPLEIATERAVEFVEACRKASVKLGIVLQHRTLSFRARGSQRSPDKPVFLALGWFFQDYAVSY